MYPIMHLNLCVGVGIIDESHQEISIIIQILTGKREHHEISRFSGLPRELYFPKGFYFPEAPAMRENIIMREYITILAPSTRDISSILVNICYKY